MEPEPQAMVESLAVVDIDPALILFDTGCKCVKILVRIEMDN